MDIEKAKTIQVAKDREYDQTKTVVPVEVARGVVIEHAPSAQALKLMHLMIATAAGRMADDTYHEIRSAEIRTIDGMRKHDKASLVPLFGELRAMTYYFDDPEKLEVSIGGFLDHAQVQYRYDDHGDLNVKWWFSRLFREQVGKSNYWAIIDRQTIFALRSKYSILLFQHLSSMFGLVYKNSVRFTLYELRSILNVEDGKLMRFADLNSRAIKPTVDEINQLSRFEIAAHKVKRGREVIAIEFSWIEKSSLEETKRELDSPKPGRRARREGKVERLVLEHPFPTFGGFSDDQFWRDVLYQTWPEWTPRAENSSTSIIADRVRKLADEQGIELDDPKIIKLFDNVVKRWKKGARPQTSS